MIIYTKIAELIWQINTPENLVDKHIKAFECDYNQRIDTKINITYTDKIIPYQGDSITNEVVDWYDTDKGFYLQKQIENQVIGEMSVNKDWTTVTIKVLEDADLEAVSETVNVLFLEIIFRNQIVFHGGMVVHGSAILYNQTGIVFSAPSGTGKTTHVKLWEKTDKALVINDDHPAIRLVEGEAIVYGTPWAGETKRFKVTSVPLKHMVVLEQAPENSISRLNQEEILKELMPRFFFPYHDQKNLVIALKNYSDIIRAVSVYRLRCLPNYEAVLAVKNELF